MRYEELTVRYGDVVAFGLLETIERIARIKANVIVDEETRLAMALAVINESCIAN